MNTQVDEDTIDLHALQAQIDLSMSFGQNLVTSWVKPASFAQTSRKKNLESEIKEYIRRPARLGVGAPIPETQSLVRETTKLKSKLEGGKQKRRREEAGNNPPSEDEEESRAGAIKKKKIGIDPFHFHWKNEASIVQKKPPVTHPAALAVGLQNRIPAGDRLNTKKLGNDPFSITEPQTALKESRKRGWLNEGKQQDEDKPGFPKILSSPPSSAKTLPKVREVERMNPNLTSSISKPTNSTISLPFSPTRSPPSSAVVQPKVIDVSQTSTPLQSPRYASSGFLHQPLLNLDGSPRGEESGERQLETPSRSKKRRRRRKTKFQGKVVGPAQS